MAARKPTSSLFANLKFTNKDTVFGTAPGAKSINPVDVFVSALSKQIALVQYLIKPEGTEPSGRAWFKQDLQGVHTVFRYGTMPFALLPNQKDDDAVTVSSYEELLDLYNNIETVASETAFKSKIEAAAVKMSSERKAKAEKNSSDTAYQERKAAAKARKQEKEAKKAPEASE
ncbi:hypothetical protein M2305_003281 [Gluconobacter cerinus]|uniref:hypothetical protein n=1 Tax=Gluconobacter cerinus TaxID=38307 RepID=UPI001B8D1245|nr:hypothetical protein [Gluconobacter cerinus]MBS0984474.1 hypothetical protein [Gluconobacter cerinus]MCW2267262.1 hypothetical protein [Gluconobacter cerinus]